MSRRKSGGTEASHRFGGDWTSVKLEILSRYLNAYTKALKNQSFRTGYIDAFAGTGYRVSSEEGGDHSDLPFPDLAEEAPQALLEGSAALALRTEPPFDSYIFIEKDPDRCRKLEELRCVFPDRADSIRIQKGDANWELQQLCRRNWAKNRAVLFLDPYGMQVDFATIESVASTRAVDLWLLFPLGIGVNRLLPQSGQIPAGWRKRLNLFLGREDWFDSFYETHTSTNLFGDEETTVVKAGVERIGRYFVERLRSVFPGVSENPRVLVNSTGCPLYLLCFAVSSQNPRAQAIALRMAKHILETV